VLKRKYEIASYTLIPDCDPIGILKDLCWLMLKHQD